MIRVHYGNRVIEYVDAMYVYTDTVGQGALFHKLFKSKGDGKGEGWIATVPASALIENGGTKTNVLPQHALFE